MLSHWGACNKFISINNTYSGFMASAGQTAMHAPQSVHLSGSMIKIGSLSAMASTGHSGTQVPQAKHASVIL
jgi:hypothetical protein